ncbi:hypothetical protein ACN47E_006397 [Coniothyrium glycines]
MVDYPPALLLNMSQPILQKPAFNAQQSFGDGSASASSLGRYALTTVIQEEPIPKELFLGCVLKHACCISVKTMAELRKHVNDVLRRQSIKVYWHKPCESHFVGNETGWNGHKSTCSVRIQPGSRPGPQTLERHYRDLYRKFNADDVPYGNTPYANYTKWIDHGADQLVADGLRHALLTEQPSPPLNTAPDIPSGSDNTPSGSGSHRTSLDGADSNPFRRNPAHDDSAPVGSPFPGNVADTASLPSTVADEYFVGGDHGLLAGNDFLFDMDMSAVWGDPTLESMDWSEPF